MQKAEWFAVDWGTSNLRVWAMDAEDRVIAQKESADGMGGLKPEQFEPALLALIGADLGADPVDILCCGMVGARQGWAEAPYSAVPCQPTRQETALKVEANDPRLHVRILPGVMQATPADVMRGEETQIAGFLAQNPDFSGTLCLPGTHTKWVRIGGGEITEFTTFMTGELFALTSRQSMLKHAMPGKAWQDSAFHEAVAEALNTPSQFAAALFGIRAKGLVGAQPEGEARARLSGLLIGLELAGAKAYWQGSEVAIIGAPALAVLYASALGQLGVRTRSVSGDDMTLAGLIAAKQKIEER